MRTNDLKGLLQALQRQPTLPKYKAGRVLGWGRRLTDQAVRDGQMPITSPGAAFQFFPTDANGRAPSSRPAFYARFRKTTSEWEVRADDDIIQTEILA